MKGLIAGAFLALAVWPAAAPAQEIQRIAAIVNDEVVSAQDLAQRIVMAIALTGLQDSPETRRRVRDQVLRALIVERLQLQEAARLKLSVTPEEMNRAFAQIERQNNIPAGRFEESLASQGVPVEAIKGQVRAELAWGKVLRRRILPTINISDEEIDAAIQRQQQNQAVSEFLVSEIFLAVDSPEQDEEIRRTAFRLSEQARQEKNFAAIARQFSQGTTAAQGGDIGWVQPGLLPDEVDAAIAKLNPGDISEPIRTVGGYYVVSLRNKRQQGGRASEPTLTLKQIAMPLAASAPQQEAQTTWDRALQIGATVQGCAEFERMAREVRTPAPVDVGQGPVSALSPELRPYVADLPVGRVSQPIRTNSAVIVYMVCDRSTGGISRDDVRDQLTQRRVELQARRLLRDLRRDAVVEFR